MDKTLPLFMVCTLRPRSTVLYPVYIVSRPEPLFLYTDAQIQTFVERALRYDHTEHQGKERGKELIQDRGFHGS